MGDFENSTIFMLPVLVAGKSFFLCQCESCEHRGKVPIENPLEEISFSLDKVISLTVLKTNFDVNFWWPVFLCEQSIGSTATVLYLL